MPSALDTDPVPAHDVCCVPCPPPSSGDDGGLKVQEIDAYWLQRRISQTLSGLDEHSAQRLAQEVLEALQVGVGLCVCVGGGVLAWTWVGVLPDWVQSSSWCVVHAPQAAAALSTAICHNSRSCVCGQCL